MPKTAQQARALSALAYPVMTRHRVWGPQQNPISQLTQADSLDSCRHFFGS